MICGYILTTDQSHTQNAGIPVCPATRRNGHEKRSDDNITSLCGSSCANNGKDALNTPERHE
eukprot:687135-Prorocentrum_minimum.AAC.1